MHIQLHTDEIPENSDKGHLAENVEFIMEDEQTQISESSEKQQNHTVEVNGLFNLIIFPENPNYLK